MEVERISSVLGSSLRRPWSAWGQAFALFPGSCCLRFWQALGQPCPLALKLWCRVRVRCTLFVKHTRQDKAKAWLIHQVKARWATFRFKQFISYIDSERGVAQGTSSLWPLSHTKEVLQWNRSSWWPLFWGVMRQECHPHQNPGGDEKLSLDSLPGETGGEGRWPWSALHIPRIPYVLSCLSGITCSGLCVCAPCGCRQERHRRALPLSLPLSRLAQRPTASPPLTWST